MYWSHEFNSSFFSFLWRGDDDFATPSEKQEFCIFLPNRHAKEMKNMRDDMHDLCYKQLKI